MIHLEFENRESLEEYLATHRDEMYDIIWKSIRDTVERGDMKAHIFDILLLSEQVYINMTSDIDDWKHSLDLACKYYSQVEDYTTCIHIKDLIKKIENEYEQIYLHKNEKDKI